MPSPNVQPETVKHEDAGGSTGPGGVSADCVCGITFSGFDTQTDALAVLNEHIADGNKRETKRADELAVGDWLNDDFFGTGPLRIVAPVFVSADWAHIVYLEHGDPEPGSVNVAADREFQLASDAEVTRAEKNRTRSSFIDSLRRFGNFLDANPDAPLPTRPSFMVHLHSEDGAARVRELADKFDSKVEDHLDDRTALRIRRDGFEYEVNAWHDKPTAPVYERRIEEPSGAPIPASVSGTPMGHHGPIVQAGPTCQACDRAIRPGHSRDWVHIGDLMDHDAVGPDQA